MVYAVLQYVWLLALSHKCTLTRLPAAFNAALTMVAILISEDVNPLDMDGQMPLPRNGGSPLLDQQKAVLNRAIECLPLIDLRNPVIEKCTKFTSALRHCAQGFREWILSFFSKRKFGWLMY